MFFHTASRKIIIVPPDRLILLGLHFNKHLCPFVIHNLTITVIRQRMILPKLKALPTRLIIHVGPCKIICEQVTSLTVKSFTYYMIF